MAIKHLLLLVLLYAYSVGGMSPTGRAADLESGSSEGIVGDGIALTVDVKEVSVLQTLAEERKMYVLALLSDSEEVSTLRQRLMASRVDAYVGLLEDWPMQHWPTRTVDALVLQTQTSIAADDAERILADVGTIQVAQGNTDLLAARPLLDREGTILRKKPTPGLDAWPMMRRDPGRSGYSRDQFAGPPQVPRWLAGPMFGEKPTLADGGLLITRSETGTGGEDQFIIRARRAHNGTLVWRRQVELSHPEAYRDNKDRFKFTHPIAEHGKLGNRGQIAGIASQQGVLYLRGKEQITRLELATGKALGSIPARDVLWMTPTDQGLLLVGDKTTRFTDAVTGKPTWSVAGDYRQPVYRDGIVVLLKQTEATVEGAADASVLEAFDAKSGGRRWTRPLTGLARTRLRSITSTGEVLVLGELYPAQPMKRDHKSRLMQLQTFTLATGEPQWHSEALAPWKNPWRLLVEVDGTFYIDGSYREEDGVVEDPRVKRFRVRSVNLGCQLAASTPNFLLFKDHGGCDLAGNHFANPTGFTLGKSVCGDQYIPAYGLSFLSSQPCGCRAAGAWLRAGHPAPDDDPLLAKHLDPFTAVGDDLDRFAVERGSADAAAVLAAHGSTAPGWTQARGGPAREGRAAAAAPRQWSVLWQRRDLAIPHGAAYATVSGPITAGDLLVVSQPEAGVVLALDRGTGKTRWQWQGDSRIPSAPVVHRGLVLAGQQSGYVVALRAGDGTLCWRTRVAPGERFIVDHGRLTSMWPVNAPLLAQGDRVYGSVGHYFHWANTPRAFAIDLGSGKVVWSRAARINGNLLRWTGQGVQPMWEFNADARWFGGIASGHFTPETGEFKSLPRTGHANPRTPASTRRYEWRPTPGGGPDRQDKDRDRGDYLTFSDGSVISFREGTLRLGDRVVVQTLHTTLAPLGLAADAHGVVVVTADGAITAFE